jgi:phenylalanyl-tRNA synthetase beta chain
VRALTGREADVTRATPLHLHPGKSADLVLDGERIGSLGVVDPRLVRAYEIDDDVVAGWLEIERVPVRVNVPLVATSRFPAIERDLAVVLGVDVSAADVAGAARTHAFVRDARVFDEYRGAQIDVAKKSLALRVTLQSHEATLTDAQADATIAAIVSDLRARFGATLRG